MFQSNNSLSIRNRFSHLPPSNTDEESCEQQTRLRNYLPDRSSRDSFDSLIAAAAVRCWCCTAALSVTHPGCRLRSEKMEEEFRF